MINCSLICEIQEGMLHTTLYWKEGLNVGYWVAAPCRNVSKRWCEPKRAEQKKEWKQEKKWVRQNDKEDKEILATKLLFRAGSSCSLRLPTADGKACVTKRQTLTNPSPLAIEVSGIKLV